jgi:RimJ/RimL family protein N-acetyltransferase
MIRKYRAEDFEWLRKWVTHPKQLFVFAGPSWSFPITEEQVVDHQRKFPGKQLYIGLNEENEPIAIGEIITNELHAPRLGRLLVGDPANRGHGLGTKFIRELIATFVALHQPNDICLFVLEENAQAIRTYEKIGFQLTDEKIPDMIFDSHAYPVLKMILINPAAVLSV